MADALCRLPRVLLDGRPAARALFCGSNAHPGLRGYYIIRCFIKLS